MAEVWERERDRLNERIRTIAGTRVAKDLKRYRRQINKKEAIDARGAGAVMTKGRNRDGYITKQYVAKDELQLLHQFLDQRDVATCNFGFVA